MTLSPYGLIVGIAFTTGWLLFEHILQKTPGDNQPPHQSHSQRSLNSTPSRPTSTPASRSSPAAPSTPVLPDHAWLLGSLLMALGSVTGARLYHLLTDWSAYAHLTPAAALRAALNLTNGGLGWYGAIIGSLAAAVIWKRLSRLPWSGSTMLDAAALSLPFMQAIGRWGNFLNQELFGPPTNLPWGIYIAPLHRPPFFADSTHFHPLFAYESLGNLGLGLALWATWRWAQREPHLIPFLQLGRGWYTAMYALSYGLLRFTLDYGRWDLAWWRVGSLALTSSQWFSLLLIIGGLLNLAWHSRPSLVNDLWVNDPLINESSTNESYQRVE